MTEETAATQEQGVSVNADTGNAAFEVSNTMGNQEPQGKTFDFSEIVPAEYKNKTWVQKYDSIDEFFKGMDGAQELLGKRPAGIPHENASPEEWNDFYSQLGRPKDPNDYKVEYPDDLPEGLSVNDEMKSGFNKLAHEIGLTQKQVEKLAAWDLESKKAMFASAQPDQAKIDQEFDNFAKNTWGDREADVLKNSAKLLEEHAPKEMQEHINNLDNKSLIALSSVLDSFTQKYLKEGDTHRGGDTPNLGPDKVALQKEAHDLMRSEAFKNAFHVDHDATKQRVNAIYKIIA